MIGLVVLDLEWNTGYGKHRLEEILQLGAVRLDRLGGRITGAFNAYVRPRVHKRYNPRTKELPDLQLSLESPLDFPTMMESFRRWCGEETEFACWGGQDVEVLQQNCAHWRTPAIVPERVYDFQAAFSALLDADRQIALYAAVEYCRIPTPFCFHNALHDALYTAMIGERMGSAALACPPRPPKRLDFSQEPFPKQPRRKVGPFATPEALLNSRPARRAACPLCGKPQWVREWRSNSALLHYGAFQCPEHGRFLCRLALSQTEDGRWRGRAAVPALTPGLLAEYRAALNKKGFVCHASGSAGRKRRRRRRKKPQEADFVRTPAES